jgi:hypothetical protein
MDINTLAAYGEFLGGIAVVVSLVYLASQIRQNSKLLRSSTATVSGDTSSHMNSLIVQDPEVARIFWEGIADRDSLSEADRRRFDPMIQLQLSGMHQEYHFSQDGIIDPSIWEVRSNGMRFLFQQPGMKQWWSEWGGDNYDTRFRVFVDGLIREGEAAG